MSAFVPQMALRRPTSRPTTATSPSRPSYQPPRRPAAPLFLQSICNAMRDDQLGVALSLLADNPLIRLPDRVAQELAAKLRTRGLQSRVDFLTGHQAEAALALLAHAHTPIATGLPERAHALAQAGDIEQAFRILPIAARTDPAALETLASASSSAGHLRHALLVLQRFFPAAGLLPTPRAYASYVDACGRVGNVRRALDALSGDFCRLPHREQALVYSHLVDACVRSRAFDYATAAVQRMKRDRVPRTEKIYVSLLTAAARNASLDASLKVLKDMGDDGFSLKKVPTYNALIVGSARSRRLRDAFNVYRSMLSAGVSPNLDTYNALLKGCAKSAKPDDAFEVLNSMERDGNVRPNAISYNFVVVACARVGDVDRAFQVSRRMRKEGIRLNIVTNNNLLEACCNAGRLERAFVMVKEMIQKQGVNPNSHTYNTLIRGCGRWGQLDAALRMLTSMRSAGVSPTVITYSVAVDACAKAGDATAVDQAFELVEDMKRDGLEPNLVTYNSLIHACARGKRADLAFQVVDQMRKCAIVPDIVTLCSLVDACGRAGELDRSFDVTQSLPREFPSLRPNVPVYNALIHACYRAGDTDRMHEAEKEMSQKGLRPNVVTFSTLISAYAAKGDIDKSLATLQRMREEGFRPNRVTFTPIIAAYGRLGQVDNAMRMLEEAKSSCGDPDAELYTAAIVATVRGGSKDLAIELASKMNRSGYYVPSVFNKMMRKVGESEKHPAELRGMLDAMEALKIRPQRNAIESLISAYAREADVASAFAILPYMNRLGYPPNLGTYKKLIQACAVSGTPVDIRRARALFRKLRSALNKNDPKLRSHHWRSIYEALVRALNKAPLAKDGTDLRVGVLRTMAEDCGEPAANHVTKHLCSNLEYN